MNDHIKSIRAFNRFYTNIIGVVDEYILGGNYSLPEVRIMYEMYHNDAATANEIANVLNMDKGYLSRTLVKLEKQKLISKKRSEDDARLVLLSLTPKGRRHFQKLDNASQQQVRQIINHLSPEKHDQLVYHMNEIQQLLTKK